MINKTIDTIRRAIHNMLNPNGCPDCKGVGCLRCLPAHEVILQPQRSCILDMIGNMSLDGLLGRKVGDIFVHTIKTEEGSVLLCEKAAYIIEHNLPVWKYSVSTCRITPIPLKDGDCIQCKEDLYMCLGDRVLKYLGKTKDPLIRLSNRYKEMKAEIMSSEKTNEVKQ